MERIWTMLEAEAPQGCERVQDLYSWSLSFDSGKGPYLLLLDLIGYTVDNFGEAMYDLSDASLGYVELSMLGKALEAYADYPGRVRDYVDELWEAETSDD